MKPRDTKEIVRCLARSGERGVVAILAALLLLTLIGFILLAVQIGDIGMVRGMLQGSADEAALAGALQLDRTADGLSNARAQAEAMVTGGRNFPQAVNQGQDLDIGGTAFDTGVWDFADGSFTPSNDPEEVNAVRVIGRKVAGQNSPVPMHLGGLLGSPDTVPVARQSIAAVGTVRSLPCRPELPIAACAADLACGVEVRLLTSNSNVDNACWTGFFSGANGSTIRNFIENCSTIPGVEVGDSINLNNGNITGPGYQTLLDELQEHQTATGQSVSDGRAVCVGTGNVHLPDLDDPTCKQGCGPVLDTEPIDINEDGVVNTLDCGMPRSIPVIPRSECSSNCNQTGPVTGFAMFVVTEVKTTGNPKYIQGIPLCHVAFPDTQSGPSTCDPEVPLACATIPILVNKAL
jgi:hypothetical protein